VDGGTTQPPNPPPTPNTANPLKHVKYWAYQIQHVDKSGAVNKLVSSKYDLLVIEPTNTDKNLSGFDGKGMVQKLHATKGKSGHKRIVLAYIDVGEAENWRYYWESWWQEPTEDEVGDPSFLVIPDPDGWADNFPVAYWDPEWKKIMIYNQDSMLQRAIDDGYDGIYMDWVEAFSDKDIKSAASDDGKDTAVEMIKFITEIRNHARKQNPGFLVVPQNAADLVNGHPEYLKVIDGIAQEQIYYDGDADTEWNDENACDKKVPENGNEYSRSFYENLLEKYKQAGLPVFNVEYACSKGKVDESFNRSGKKGYVTYVSRRPLSRLSDDHPPGY
jgi:cysteinyl-tRNA synthetase